jgi:hypothetical protein
VAFRRTGQQRDVTDGNRLYCNMVRCSPDHRGVGGAW